VLLDARSIPQDAVVESEVCIVGAGAVGITLAGELAGLDFRVCLLESGGLTPDETTQALAEGQNAGLPYAPLETTRSRYFGGTTNRWTGTCRTLDEIDFEARSWIPHSGWPFPKAHLDPYYERARELCELPPCPQPERPRPLPLGTTRVATTLFEFSRPTRFGQAYGHELVRAPNVSVYLNANVVELETTEAARAVTHLRVACLMGNTFRVAARLVVLAAGGIENARLLLLSRRVRPAGLGNDHDLVGRFFMEHPHVAAGVIVPAHPYIPSRLYKQCRVNGAVIMGALTLSPDILRRERLANYSALLIPEEVSPRMEALKHAYRSLRKRTGTGDVWRDVARAARGLRVTDVARATYGLLVNGQLPLTQFRIISRTEQTPNPESRVTLALEKDRLGQNVARLHWRLSPIDIRTIRRALAIIGEELERARLGQLLIDLDGDDPTAWSTPAYGGYHHMGTTRMHVSPAEGVVDEQCRVHGISNLFVAGSSVFPTGGHANPMLTIVALALRLADRVKATMKERPGDWAVSIGVSA
jgi:choline dehydrogenase-like flavoprotein